jgi:glucose/mannose-6-phosphate isomerase
MTTLNQAVLDDAEAIEEADAADMLRAVASSGAQVREAARRTRETPLSELVEAGRPRAVVVAGMGGSGITGDVLAGVAGPACPAIITSVRGYTLPGWVGPVDLVVGVSCSGSTEETLAVTEEASRRGCQLVTVGAADSPLAAISQQARGGIHVAVDGGDRLPRANMWALSVPLLVLGDALGLFSVPEQTLESTADLLDNISGRCRPASESFVNPAKLLALELAASVPMVWGTSELAGVAAYRFACQLNENGKYPAVYGVLPEANHNQVVAFDGPFGTGGQSEGPVDFYRDRVDDAEPETRLRLVLLRDTQEHPQVARRREASRELAEAREIPVSEIAAEGEHPLERLASLVALTDYASVYLALALGIDPSPIAPITDLKERISR